METRFARALIVLGGLVATLAATAPAHAQTRAQAQTQAEHVCRIPEAGVWINDMAEVRQIRRIEIESFCEGEGENVRAAVRMRAFTRCSPRDCKWGWQPAYRTAGGRLIARFPGFFGAREIQVIFMGRRIEALVTIDPHDPTEPDSYHAAILARE